MTVVVDGGKYKMGGEYVRREMFRSCWPAAGNGCGIGIYWYVVCLSSQFISTHAPERF